MGRFERKIRKKLQQDVPPFDQWFEEHKDQLAKFDRPQESAEDQGEVRAKRRVPTYAWIVGAAVLLLTALALTLAFLLPREQTQPQIPLQPSIPDLTFGDEAVSTVAMTDDELTEILQQMPQLDDLSINLKGTKFLYNVDGSTVLLSITGEFEAMEGDNLVDYYFVEARIERNENFIFYEKSYYDDLNNSMTIGNTQISYELMGKDINGFNEYFILSESDSATIYWTVSSISGEIDEWLQMTFAE